MNDILALILLFSAQDSHPPAVEKALMFVPAPILRVQAYINGFAAANGGASRFRLFA